MYYEFFGLSQAPFRITPNTDFFFGGGNRGPILEALIYAVTHGEGIIKVSGEVGSGKTMLCNMLMERLPENVETVYLANPSVSPEEILHAIAFELQLTLERHTPRLEVTQVLQAYLLKRHAEGKRVVVFVEESQGMPIATLEEIRLLSNLETRNDKLLQIVLFGQPELDENLRLPNIRQLRERITHSFGLAPLIANDVREYLMFRMRAAGYRGPDLFSDRIVKMITRASGGLTRRVNLIADKALLAAFSENTHTIKPRHIEAALRDSEFSHVSVNTSAPNRWGWLMAAVLGCTLGAAGYWAITQSLLAVAPAPAASSVTVPPSSAPAATPASSPPVSSIPIASGSPVDPAKAAEPADTITGPATGAPVGGNKGSAATPQPLDVQTTQNVNDVLLDRMAQTEQWLSQRKDSEWTLQTLSTASETDLRNYLRILSKSIEIKRIFVYRHTQNAEPAGGKAAQNKVESGPSGIEVNKNSIYSVIYSNYGSRTEAEKALANLPAQLQSNRPLPVMIGHIRSRLRT